MNYFIVKRSEKFKNLKYRLNICSRLFLITTNFIEVRFCRMQHLL
jgi:hypothetical protein